MAQQVSWVVLLILAGFIQISTISRQISWCVWYGVWDDTSHIFHQASPGISVNRGLKEAESMQTAIKLLFKFAVVPNPESMWERTKEGQ
jgi:hypothetical protein